MDNFSKQIYEAGINDGRAEGKAEGLAEGKAEGKAESIKNLRHWSKFWGWAVT